MIISHRHRFIFIHCRKTAGSAIKAYLARFLGPNDLQIGCWGDTVAAGVGPNRRFIYDMLLPDSAMYTAKRTIFDPTIWSTDKRWSVLNKAHKRHYKKKIGHSPAHPTAKQIRWFAPREFSEYTKFCVVRNPFGKAVSDYYWLRDRASHSTSFRDVLHEMRYGAEKYNNWPMYTIDDRVVVDRIARYENLHEDLGTILEELGIPLTEQGLPTAKDVRGVGRDTSLSLFGEEEIKLVREMFGREIEYFGYSVGNA